jgi:two-component system KDP operon response regulator KdpE
MMTSVRPEGLTLRPNILIIEDDPTVRRLLNSYLRDEDLKITEAVTASDGLDAIARRTPDVVLLDLRLPDMDGFKVIETIRERMEVAIIVLSGEADEAMKIKCLEAGADDYITKPFTVTEVLARIRVALRRTPLAPPVGEDPIFEVAQLRIDRQLHTVWVHGEEVHLTPIEYKLLAALVMRAGKVVSQKKLLTEIWGPDFTTDAQYLRVYMGYLRKKIEPRPESKHILLTEPRVGYRLEVDAS